MTPGSIRRAEERKARKEMERKAKKAALRAQRHSAPELLTHMPSSGMERLVEDLRTIAGDPDYEEQTDQPLFSPGPLSLAPLSTDKPAHLGNSKTLSPAQLAANRANAQFSSGPASAEGKAKSSLNAVKTA